MPQCERHLLILNHDNTLMSQILEQRQLLSQEKVRRPQRNGPVLVEPKRPCIICTAFKVVDTLCKSCKKPIVLRCSNCNHKSWAESDNQCKCGT